MRINRPAVLILPAFFLMMAAESPAWAARLLTATVELDGEVVLSSVYGDDSNPHPERVWRSLGREPSWAEVANVSADPANALRASLQGDVVIRIEHTDRLVVGAEASELTLVRKHPSSHRWFLPDEEVERIASANGIAKPSLLALSERESWVAAFLSGGVALLATLIIVAWWRMRTSQSKAS